jgi:hypothetical protein
MQVIIIYSKLEILELNSNKIKGTIKDIIKNLTQ